MRSVLGVHWKDWCWSWNSNTLATLWEELTHWKRPWCWEGLRAGGEGDNRGWDGWMASPTRWAWVWVTPGVCDGQGGLACCNSWGRKESDMTERLNWTDWCRGSCHLQTVRVLLLSNPDSFYFFSSLIVMAKTSKTMLNSSGKNGHPCLVPDFRGNAFNFSPLRIMFAVGLLYIAFIMLRYVPSMPAFRRVLS